MHGAGNLWGPSKQLPFPRVHIKPETRSSWLDLARSLTIIFLGSIFFVVLYGFVMYLYIVRIRDFHEQTFACRLRYSRALNHIQKEGRLLAKQYDPGKARANLASNHAPTDDCCLWYVCEIVCFISNFES